MNNKESYLSNLVGEERYNRFKPYAKFVFLAYSGVLAILFLLTKVCHWMFVSEIFSLFTGTSLFFLLYVAFAILCLDIRVSEVYRVDWRYKLTIVWGVFLIIVGLAAIVYTNRCRNAYAFECVHCYIEEDCGYFHVHKKCGSIIDKSLLQESKVYKAQDKGLKLCEECEERLEDLEYESESLRYSRR